MSSSSDEDETYVFYKDRPEWNNITPIPQDDGVSPVVQIAYSEKFTDAYNYLRAVLAADEHSERALELTETALSLNPANYTVWEYRRMILKALKKDIAVEMKFLSNIIVEQQKNYQVWHHRRALVEWSRNSSEELEFTAKILHMDQKNYHAWQHRQWVIKEFQLWDDELDFVDFLISQDMRNNSAWNQRYFVILHTTGYTDDVIRKEIGYTVKKIDLVTKNESSWNYLRGILQDRPLSWDLDLREQILMWRKEGLKSPQLASFLMDILVEDIEAGDCDTETTLGQIKEICKELSEETDVVRKKYWNFMYDSTLKQCEVNS